MLSCQEGTNRDLHKVKLKGETATFSHSRAQWSVSLSSEKWWLLSGEILVLLCVTAISLELPSLWPLKVTGVTRVLSFSWGRKWGVKVGNGWGFRRRGMASKIHIFEGGEWLGIYKVGNGFKNSHFWRWVMTEDSEGAWGSSLSFQSTSPVNYSGRELSCYSPHTKPTGSIYCVISQIILQAVSMEALYRKQRGPDDLLWGQMISFRASRLIQLSHGRATGSWAISITPSSISPALTYLVIQWDLSAALSHGWDGGGRAWEGS